MQLAVSLLALWPLVSGSGTIGSDDVRLATLDTTREAVQRSKVKSADCEPVHRHCLASRWNTATVSARAGSRSASPIVLATRRVVIEWARSCKMGPGWFPKMWNRRSSDNVMPSES